MKHLSFLFLFFCLFSKSLYAQDALLKNIEIVDEKQNFIRVAFDHSGAKAPFIFYMGGDKPRMVLDFPKTCHLLPNTVSLSSKIIKRARIGRHDLQKTRVVLDMDLNYPKPQWQVEEKENRLIINISWNEFLSSDTKVPPYTVLSPAKVKKKYAAQPEKNTSLQADKQERPKLRRTVQTFHENYGNTKQNIGSKEARETIVPTASKNTEKNDQIVPAPVALYSSKDIEEDSEALVALNRIEFSSPKEGTEDILALFLSDYNVPTISSVEGEALLVLCEFQNVALAKDIERDMVLDGRYIKRITFSEDPLDKHTRLVIHLCVEHNYDLKQVYYKNANIFSIKIKGY